MKINLRNVVFSISALAAGVTFVIWLKEALKITDCTEPYSFANDTSHLDPDFQKIYAMLQKLCESEADSSRKMSSVCAAMSATSALVFSTLVGMKTTKETTAVAVQDDSYVLTVDPGRNPSFLYGR